MANVTCVVGDSGDGKSSFCASFVDHILRKFPGKKARLVSCDNVDAYEPYIDAGVLAVWPVALWDFPFEVWDYATQGYWPEDPTNPKSKILAPTAKTWEDVRLYIFEGLTGESDTMMKRLADIGGQGISIGPGTRANTRFDGKGSDDKSDLINFKDGTYGVGGNAQSHYNIVQKEVRKNVLNTSVLPVTVLWTALPCRSIEDGKPIYGPMVAGSKATPKVQQWVSSLVHTYCDSQGAAPKYQLYFKEHVIKETGPIPWKSIQRVPLRLLDPKIKQVIENKWNQLIPTVWDWTNDSTIADKYIELKNKMREAVKQILTGGE